MRIVFSFLMFSLHYCALAQHSADDMQEKAFGFFFQRVNIDSALHYYRLLQKDHPNYRPGYINYQVGTCLYEKGDTSSAIAYYQRSLRQPEKLDIYPERACLFIADKFLSIKEYAKALSYYDSSTSYFRTKVTRMSQHDSREGNVLTIYKKAFCFDKIGQLDTAINIMTPVMFFQYDHTILPVPTVDQIVTYYVYLLRKKYSDEEIGDRFKTAVENAVFIREIDSVLYKRDPERKGIRVAYYFYFLGKKILFYEGGIRVTDFEETPLGWREEDIMEEFYRTPTFRRLRMFAN